MKKNRGILFSFINGIVFILLPFCIILTITYLLLTAPSFYTRVIKHTDLIGTFVQAKNMQITKAIQEEIDLKVGLASYTLQYQALKKQYEESQKAFDVMNKTLEYEKLNQHYDELKALNYRDVQQAFPDERAFKDDKQAKLENIEQQVRAIKEYRRDNRKDIAASKDQLEAIQNKYDDAHALYNEKQEEAQEIIKEHHSAFSATLTDDLKKLKPVMERIINEKLIDDQLHPLISRYITFFTSYDAIKHEYILELTPHGTAPHQQTVKKILLPDVSIHFWVHHDGQLQHLFSDIMVDEIKKFDYLNNRSFFIALFTFADSALGEFFGGRYFKKAGLNFDNGVVYNNNIILTGADAHWTILLIQIFSYGKYILIALLLLSAVYLFYLFISSVGGKTKLLWLKRILLYPPLMVIVLISAGIVSYHALIGKSIAAPDLSAQLAQQFVCTMSIYMLTPIAAVCAVLFMAGLVLRRISIST